MLLDSKLLYRYWWCTENKFFFFYPPSYQTLLHLCHTSAYETDTFGIVSHSNIWKYSSGQINCTENVAIHIDFLCYFSHSKKMLAVVVSSKIQPSIWKMMSAVTVSVMC